MCEENFFTVEILPDEYWWGGCVEDGVLMPYYRGMELTRTMHPHKTVNQAAPLLLSSKGRYIWCEDEFDFYYGHGEICIVHYDSCPVLYAGFENLRDAYLHACQNHFPPTGIMPPETFIKQPQYNTWIELLYNQNEHDILQYARSILENGLPAGILMIDDGWNKYYGQFDFDHEKFPNPAEMVKQLHEMGFMVMLWMCPFLSPDSANFRFAQQQEYLVKNEQGKTAVREWWNGYSAVVDFSNEDAVTWFDGQCRRLMDTYGVDGFKFDAGDAYFYDNKDITRGNVSANEQSELWAKFGERYAYNEFRACWKRAGHPLVQRLCDKNHSWNKDGMASLVPNILAQGLLGYAYSCPDMIGGGEYSSFLENSGHLDTELFVRYAQCAALMPMMQFSAAPWRVLDAEHFELCKAAVQLHLQYADTILQLAREAAVTGEPIVRYMAYVFPNEQLEEVCDQFMLGNDILVAPVLQKKCRIRKVVLPKGLWRDLSGMDYVGGKVVSVKASMQHLPVFHRM